MSQALRRIIREDHDPHSLVRFADRKILDAANIQEMGEELFNLVDREKRTKIALSFSQVEFLSSAALNKLIMLERMCKNAGGQLVMCDVPPEIFEVFAITRLNQLFKIAQDSRSAFKALGS